MFAHLFKATLTLTLIGVFSLANAQTVAELNAQYEHVVKTEAAILDQIERAQRHVDNRNLILIGEVGGDIQAMTRREMDSLLNRLSNSVQLLQLDQVYLNSLPWTKRLVASALINSKFTRNIALDRLAAQSERLRAGEREKIRYLQEELAQTRAFAVQVLAERDRIQTWVETGEGQPPALSTGKLGSKVVTSKGANENFSGDAIATNPLCSDPDYPADRTVRFRGGGYPSSDPYAVKGDYICRGRSFQYLHGNTLDWYQCAGWEDLRDCTYDPARSTTFEYDEKRNGFNILRFPNSSIAEFYPL